MTRAGTAYFVDRLHLLAEALGVELDEIGFEVEYAQTTEDLDDGSWTVPKGCVAGLDYRWQGKVGGRVVFEHRSRLIKGATLDPDWSSDLQGGWTVEVTGRPDVRAAVRLSFDISSMEEFTGLGLVATAMPAVNAIRNVVAARPGIVTYLDVDVATARGFVRV